MLITSFIEDLYQNIHYFIRLIAIFLSSFLIIIFYLEFKFPLIDYIPFLDILFNFPLFNFIFFSLCLVTVVNGSNFIDGMNGLVGFYFVGAIISCLNLCYLTNDLQNTDLLIICIITMIAFLSLNFPHGKIFAGDSGAYLFSLILGAWVIKFFSEHEEISSWNAFLIFFYPTMEIIYSYIRKAIMKKSPFLPDRGHLHLKIYDLINFSTKRPKLSNNLTTIFLSIFWTAPPLMLPLVFDNTLLILLTIILLIFTYISVNFFVPSIYMKGEI